MLNEEIITNIKLINWCQQQYLKKKNEHKIITEQTLHTQHIYHDLIDGIIKHVFV